MQRVGGPGRVRPECRLYADHVPQGVQRVRDAPPGAPRNCSFMGSNSHSLWPSKAANFSNERTRECGKAPKTTRAIPLSCTFALVSTWSGRSAGRPAPRLQRHNYDRARRGALDGREPRRVRGTGTSRQRRRRSERSPITDGLQLRADWARAPVAHSSRDVCDGRGPGSARALPRLQLLPQRGCTGGASITCVRPALSVMQLSIAAALDAQAEAGLIAPMLCRARPPGRPTRFCKARFLPCRRRLPRRSRAQSGARTARCA